MDRVHGEGDEVPTEKSVWDVIVLLTHFSARIWHKNIFVRRPVLFVSFFFII